MSEERGVCCFCKGDCNSLGQSCGKCARLLTGHSLGWNALPKALPKADTTQIKVPSFVREPNPEVYFPECQKCKRKFPCLERFKETCFHCS